MEDWSNFLTKASINGRFVQAINHILAVTEGLTKSSLAEELCSKPAKFSEILNGRMNAGTDMIATVCELFGVSPLWILLSRGPMLFPDIDKEPYFVWNGEGATGPEPHNKASEGSIINQESTNETLLSIIREKDETIRGQAEQIGALKERLRAFELPKNSSSTVMSPLEIENATPLST